MAECSKEPVVTIGIDLAKNSVHVYGVDAQGRQVISKKVTRGKLSAFMVNLPACLVAMEACGSAHHWARVFREVGHEVRLIAPQFVKPYVKSNKNDAVDAKAICEAVQRPNMRFVAVKSVEQQDIQAIHRMRSLSVERRTAQINQVRGLLLEYGVEIPKGRTAVMRRIPESLEDAENGLSERFRAELSELAEELRHLDERVRHDDARIQAIAQHDPTAQRLMTIPGLGAQAATALLAAAGENPQVFGNGRALAAWIGLVPRRHSTGGRERLPGIGKRGDVYLRNLLIRGARAVLRRVESKEDPVSRWAATLKGRRQTNVAIVALANKIARVADAVMTTGHAYDPAKGSPAHG
ncbi:transposase [Thiocapsa sp. KS1]|nr:IS110 family transposase [Thiocapsa sp. KS1]CRI66056.1 transposase [Thiocapsa sp. KS1]